MWYAYTEPSGFRHIYKSGIHECPMQHFLSELTQQLQLRMQDNCSTSDDIYSMVLHVSIVGFAV